jgi:hypothetical protein
LPVTFLGETVDFLNWAEAYVNQLDPLQSVVRSGEFEKSTSYHFQNDFDRMKDAFGRLLGADWKQAWKVGRDYSPQPKSEPSWYSREKSVFEVQPSRRTGGG